MHLLEDEPSDRRQDPDLPPHLFRRPLGKDNLRIAPASRVNR